MTKLFFDGLEAFENLEKEIKKIAGSAEEKSELWHLVDDLVHFKMLDSILEKLPQESHEEFMTKYHERPFDNEIVGYLKGKIGENIEEILKSELGQYSMELLDEVRGKEHLGKTASENKE